MKALKKPTRPAALVNWLSREREREVKALAKLAARMRDPKLGGDPARLRAAVAEEREVVEGLVAAAAEELEARGGPAATLDRVGETLRAMASDPDVEELVLARRLEREQEAATVGFAMEGGVSFTPSKAKQGGGKEGGGQAREAEGPRSEEAPGGGEAAPRTRRRPPRARSALPRGGWRRPRRSWSRPGPPSRRRGRRRGRRGRRRRRRRAAWRRQGRASRDSTRSRPAHPHRRLRPTRPVPSAPRLTEWSFGAAGHRVACRPPDRATGRYSGSRLRDVPRALRRRLARLAPP